MKKQTHLHLGWPESIWNNICAIFCKQISIGNAVYIYIYIYNIYILHNCKCTDTVSTISEIHAWSLTSVKSCICLGHHKNVYCRHWAGIYLDGACKRSVTLSWPAAHFRCVFEGSHDVKPAGENINTMTCFHDLVE